MSQAPIRIVILLAAISLAGILATHVYWSGQAISSREKQFSHSVQMALRNVVEGLCEIDGNDFPVTDPIEQISSNYFIVRTKNKIDLKSLEYLIRAELEKRQINHDFEYGVYDCQSEEMVYGNLVSFGEESESKAVELPTLKEYDYYFGVLFPNLSANLLWGLPWWKLTTGLTAIVIIFFGYSLSIIFRQKRLSAVQRDFINNITHEFKTPISTLKIASEVLSDPVMATDGKKIQQYAGIVRKESARLEEHVHQLLRTALIEEDKKVNLEKVALSSLLTETVKGFVSDKEVSLSCPENVFVLAERYYLQTAVHNLVENALKYGGSLVKVSCANQGHDVLVSVSDNGNGIDQKNQKKLFTKFYRVNEGDQHNVRGFGLGLYVVKKLMAKMNGSVCVKSTPGNTVFTLKLKAHA